jgi:hypothetical protein
MFICIGNLGDLRICVMIIIVICSIGDIRIISHLILEGLLFCLIYYWGCLFVGFSLFGLWKGLFMGFRLTLMALRSKWMFDKINQLSWQIFFIISLFGILIVRIFIILLLNDNRCFSSSWILYLWLLYVKDHWV